MPAAQPAPAKRVALVIGVKDYADARGLTTPLDDAQVIKSALSKLGFTVVLEPNRNWRRLSAALDDFVPKASGRRILRWCFSPAMGCRLAAGISCYRPTRWLAPRCDRGFVSATRHDRGPPLRCRASQDHSSRCLPQRPVQEFKRVGVLRGLRRSRTPVGRSTASPPRPGRRLPMELARTARSRKR